MPTINGQTINTKAQLAGMGQARLLEIADRVGVPKSYKFSDARREGPGIRNWNGVKEHTIGVLRRRLELRFGLRKTSEKAQSTIAKAVRKRQANKKVTGALESRPRDFIYKKALAMKREKDRHCGAPGRTAGLRRMTKPQLLTYIKGADKHK